MFFFGHKNNYKKTEILMTFSVTSTSPEALRSAWWTSQTGPTRLTTSASNNMGSVFSLGSDSISQIFALKKIQTNTIRTIYNNNRPSYACLPRRASAGHRVERQQLQHFFPYVYAFWANKNNYTLKLEKFSNQYKYYNKIVFLWTNIKHWLLH